MNSQDRRDTYFGKWLDEIIYYDNQNWQERVIVYWALTEKYVEYCFSEFKAPDFLLCYEDLVRNREEILSEILLELGVEKTFDGDFSVSEDSPTTTVNRRDISTKTRLFGWKQELTPEVVRSIENIVTHFGLEKRFYDEI